MTNNKNYQHSPDVLRVSIEVASEADLASIAELERARSWQKTDPALRQRKGFIMTLLSEEQLRALTKSPSDLIVVAKCATSKKVIGAMLVYGYETTIEVYPYLKPYMTAGSSCYLKSILVNTKFEGRWVSTRLVERLYQWMKDAHLVEVLTEVCAIPENKPSMALVRRAKMEEVCRIDDSSKGVVWALFRLLLPAEAL